MSRQEHNPSRGNIEIGQGIVDQIRVNLGDRLIFPDRDGELIVLQEKITELDSFNITEDDYTVEAQTQERSLVTEGAIGRLKNHATMLNIGKVWAQTSGGDFDWVDIRPGDKTKFESVLNDVENDIDDQIIDGITNPLTIDPETKSEIEGSFCQEVTAMLQEISDIIPAPHGGDSTKLLGRLAVLFVVRHVTEPHYHEEELTNESLVKTSRKVRKLNSLLSELQQNPAFVLLGSYIQSMKNDLNNRGAEIIDDLIARRNSTVLSHISTDTQTTYSRPEIPTQINEDTKESKVKTTDPEVIIEQRKETTVTEVASCRILLPWINEGDLTAVRTKKASSGTSDVLVVWGIPAGKMEEIAETSRSKSQPAKDEDNQYDVIVDRIAKNVAEGIMPYHKSSGLKRPKSPSVGNYKGTSIWYYSDRSSNSGRVYFTLGLAGDISTTGDLRRIGIDPSSLAIIILAETDKTGQLDVLNAFTGLSRRKLRDQGAGST